VPQSPLPPETFVTRGQQFFNRPNGPVVAFPRGQQLDSYDVATINGWLQGGRSQMAFLFNLETRDGVPAEPPQLATAVPNWKAGDTIPLGRQTLRVVRVRDEDADEPPVLAVEDAPRDKPVARIFGERGST
jgi:hypothetical protein